MSSRSQSRVAVAVPRGERATTPTSEPSHKVGRVAVIVGAGWSKVAGWPDTSQLLDYGAHLVTKTQAGRFIHVWDAFYLWRQTAAAPVGDVFMAEVLAGHVPGVSWSQVVEVVAAAVASAGTETRGPVSPRYSVSLHRPSPCTAHRVFLDIPALAGVVSLNYDLLVEQALRPHPMKRPPTPGFFYGGLPRPQVCKGRGSLPWRRVRADEPLMLTGTVPVWKPHGSLNWQRQWANLNHTSAVITIYSDLRAAFRGHGEAAIIPPVDVEASAPPWLSDIWVGAANLLASATEWRVVGYSLPSADVALREMLRIAARAGNLQRIVVRNRSDRTRDRWEALAGGVRVEFGAPLT